MVVSLPFLVVLDSQDSTVETQKASEQQEAAVTEQNLPLEIPANEMNGTGKPAFKTTIYFPIC